MIYIEIYLVIITTVLVITQIVRVTQNHIQLKRQNNLFKKQLGQIDDITQDDIDRQREVYRMLYGWLSKKEMEENEANNTH